MSNFLIHHGGIVAFFNLKDINNKIGTENILESHSKQFFSESVRNQKFSRKNFDIFLSHSYLDATQIYVIKKEIESMGFSVYVDWLEDSHLDRTNVNKNTALLIKERMRDCKSLFYATTVNYQSSKWMPWELGYFDGIKEKVAILPILENDISSYKGTEYLEIYPFVDKTPTKNSSIDKLWINEDHNKYVELSKWLNGELPYER